MQIVTFASIEIGSYEVGMKILELSQKNGMKEIDDIRYGLELGKDAYNQKEISNEMLEELCEVLEDFTRIMKEYQVDDYRACATSAIRETRNCLLILDKIRVRTGLEVEVLSNSEHRFLGYKSIASNEESFRKSSRREPPLSMWAAEASRFPCSIRTPLCLPRICVSVPCVSGSAWRRWRTGPPISERSSRK
ncbi:MAG: hypothetical protein V8Q40_14105 [Anaerosacchariphilus sp.]